ncbi:MAG: chromosomal replication initiator protein DnaA [Candidatus Berkelbacteria bacterium]
MDYKEIWTNTLGELQISLSKANFVTWFKNTFIADFKKGVLTIGVPTIFIEDWLKKKYLKEIEKALQKQISEKIEVVKFKVAAPKNDQIVQIDETMVIHKPVDKTAPLQSSVRTVFQESDSTSLNRDYTLNNFIIGSSNQLAFAAAEAVSNKPGEKYNPLYIYGGSGLGKTHLMQAIGNAFCEKHPNKKVLYITTETFINDYINAVGSGFGKAKDFKNRYRNVDLLLIDDIQFLSAKEGTQEEFFHTFNHLHQNKKQVVLTSDRTPKEIKGLELRLKTRFEGGMVTDISLPDVETREAILRQKAAKMNWDIEKEIITYIAENIKSSVRELEGALNKIVATCELTGVELTYKKAGEILGNIINEKKQTLSPDLVIREVHKYYKLPIEDILGKKRVKELVLPRQLTMYLLRHECGMSYPDIGKEIGGKDHSTIMHGCGKIEASLSTDMRMKEDLSKIKESIYSMI